MSYKQAKENFVSGSVGGSITTINCVCITAITTYALWTLIAPRLPSRASSLKIPSIEFLVLVLPLLLALTLISAYPLMLNALLVLALIILNSALPPPLMTPPLSPATSKKFPSGFGSPMRDLTSVSGRLFNRPFVTVYRAHMMLMTVICILAVDFPIFPREFAKAETYGTSIMDLGVGSFVFSLGLISALPLLRQKERSSSVLVDIWRSIKKSAGLLVLGLVRVAMVKGVDYPEHVTEYGVHWNFFFTMALLPILGTGLERLSPRVDFTLMALIISGVHQLLLSVTSLSDWTLTAARLSLISQNKEGIVSLPGYLSIYLFGLASGVYVLPPDPSFYAILHRQSSPSDPDEVKRKLEDKKQKVLRSKPDKLASVLGSYAAIWWTVFGITRWSGVPVSRRLANLSYVLWVAAFNTSFLFLYLVVHMWALASPTTRSSSAPAIFEAINRNGLVVFLVANLLTGLVNISIESMYASNTVAMLGLIGYCAAVVGSGWVLRTRRLRI